MDVIGICTNKTLKLHCSLKSFFEYLNYSYIVCFFYYIFETVKKGMYK